MRGWLGGEGGGGVLAFYPTPAVNNPAVNVFYNCTRLGCLSCDLGMLATQSIAACMLFMLHRQ